MRGDLNIYSVRSPSVRRSSSSGQSRFGGGLLASVDGLRFVVPVKSTDTGPSPKYYSYKRGVTWLNAVNDQVAEIGAMVMRGTPRDSLFTRTPC